MRCKNCGTYNDDNRYICETCGSPLYDEEEIAENDKTQTFSAVSTETGSTTETSVVNPESNITDNKQNNSNDKKPNNDKKSIIVIAILAVVLIAIIASIIVVAQSRSKEDESTTLSTTESTSQTTKEYTTEYTTERTTAATTTTTTTTTAPPTTEAETWYINVSSSGGGTVSGGGEFKNGDKVTLTASPDSGYEFDGWYSNGIKVSNKQTYSFTANENISYSAVFNPVETTAEPIEDMVGEEN